MEATEDSVGYTRHLCVVCNYSYLSDFVTSGDTGYIEEEVQEPQHKHLYQLHVQDNAEDIAVLNLAKRVYEIVFT